MVSPTWTDEETATALRLRRKGMPYPEIAKKIGRTASAISKRVHKMGGVEMDHAWTAAQIEHLSRNRNVYPSELAKEISALGPERSVNAVKSKLRSMGFERPSGDWRGNAITPGWPVMRGDPDERDARFVRLIIKEALRIGLLRGAA